MNAQTRPENEIITDSYFGIELSEGLAPHLPAGTVCWINRLKKPVAGRHHVLLEHKNSPYRIVCLLIGETDTDWFGEVDEEKCKFPKSQFQEALCIVQYDAPDALWRAEVAEAAQA
jgi:hypothetical protein